MMRTRILLALSLPFALGACDTLSGMTGGGSGSWPYTTLGQETPLVIAHRGASGALPEHTLEAYHRALNDGADCIEPDLVMSKDGVLVDRHDTFLSTTTNIASHPEFANRKRKSPDPEFEKEDWWVADFTLAELKTLRAIQPFKGRSKAFDGLYQIATFDEVLDLAKSRHTVADVDVCVYPEAKSPAYHAAIGHADMAEKILGALEKHGLATQGSPVFIQSFEPDFVKKIDAMTDLPVVMLVSDKAALDDAMAKPGAPFWQGLGPNLGMLFDAQGKSTGVVEAAHAKGIAVHPWTFRDDVPMGAPIEDVMKTYLALGIDGFFTDFALTGYKVRNDVLHAAE
jgi:glycerophosphoryl diester phosphodiesterase